MTREEARNLLRNSKLKSNNAYSLMLNEALEMAIEALSVEPCDDAVSRKAVLEIQAKYAEYMGATKFWQMRDDIKALSPVTPQQKVGQWIKYSFPRCGEQHYQCTACGYYINFGQWGEFYTREFKYCPHCGLPMVSEPQKNEDDKNDRL